MAANVDLDDADTQPKDEASQLEAYRVGLHRFLMGRIHDRERAKDLVQDVYVSLLKRIEAGEPIENLQAYCYTVAAHLASRHSQSEARSGISYVSELPDQDQSHHLPGDSTYEDVIADEELDRIIGAYPEPQQKMLELSALGIKLEEIAACLGYTLDTVKTYLTRIRSACRKSWTGR